MYKYTSHLSQHQPFQYWKAAPMARWTPSMPARRRRPSWTWRPGGLSQSLGAAAAAVNGNYNGIRWGLSRKIGMIWDILDDLGWFWKIVRWFLDTLGWGWMIFTIKRMDFDWLPWFESIWKWGIPQLMGTLCYLHREHNGEPVDFGVLYF